MEEIVAVHEPMELWNKFREHFFAHLRSMSTDQLHKFWHVSAQCRTEQYREILKQMASGGNGMRRDDYDREQLRIDARFCEKVDEVKVPIVLVEYENVCKRSHEEVAKLLSTSVPLRVLMTMGQWSEKQYAKTWSSTSLSNWERTIRSFAKLLEAYGMPLRGVLGILVGECGPEPDRILRYYYFHCDLSRLQHDAIFSEQREERIGPAPLSH